MVSTSTGLVVLNKASGVLTEDLRMAVERHLQCPSTSVSRLDRPTSGLLPVVLGDPLAPTVRWPGDPVPASLPCAAPRFQAQFAGRLVRKEYLCLCASSVRSRTRHSGTVSSRLLVEDTLTRLDARGREALTIYEVLESYVAVDGMEVALVKAEPKTGSDLLAVG